MAHPWHHSISTAKKWGGKPSDYTAIHNWFDDTKRSFADFRHRALRHHAEGIFECERVFGVTITNSDGRQVPVRIIGEQHVKEDLGRIPNVADWLRNLRVETWMRSPQRLPTEMTEPSTPPHEQNPNDGPSA